ncbi:hypothetical protein [Pseudanabaena sp. PCC 6802]|uniref:hypothetical protein n=1 Tax=Pseudanabaena sp. PCC 6802 TaxID=118173 RepID=UPI00034D559F|nr:hypothetical protein [Pseudanabaena sp. PCC 6802]
MNRNSDEDLTLLAIAIFTLSMSVLIGPAIGLSPLIPTTLTAVLLGLYGIYASGWGGQGRSILMAWWQEASPQQRDRLLHHEAGHFLAAYLLGIKIVGYNLSPIAAAKQGQLGAIGVEVDVDRVMPDRLERYCTVWMAGIAAEEYIYQDAKGGAEDIRQLRNATAHLPNPELHQRWALLRARTLIAEHQEAYQALVLQMQQNATVENCYAAIDLTLSNKTI